MRQVTPGVNPSISLKTQVRDVNKTKANEVTPSDILKVHESDFSERAGKEDPVSRDDYKILSTIRENITQKDDRHCEMPLPGLVMAMTGKTKTTEQQDMCNKSSKQSSKETNEE